MLIVKTKYGYPKTDSEALEWKEGVKKWYEFQKIYEKKLEISEEDFDKYLIDLAMDGYWWEYETETHILVHNEYDYEKDFEIEIE